MNNELMNSDISITFKLTLRDCNCNRLYLRFVGNTAIVK